MEQILASRDRLGPRPTRPVRVRDTYVPARSAAGDAGRTAGRRAAGRAVFALPADRRSLRERAEPQPDRAGRVLDARHHCRAVAGSAPNQPGFAPRSRAALRGVDQPRLHPCPGAHDDSRGGGLWQALRPAGAMPAPPRERGVPQATEPTRCCWAATTGCTATRCASSAAQDRPIALGCKRSGFCPSWGACRMSPAAQKPAG